MLISRGMRMSQETFEKLQRLVRVSGKQQYMILHVAIDELYARTLKGPKYGSALKVLEESDALAKAAGDVSEPRRRVGITVRLPEAEAVELRRKAFEETGDPGQGHALARSFIREGLSRMAANEPEEAGKPDRSDR